MPLEPGSSKSAFSHNVKVEMEAGKPQKQAVAIAYSEERRTSHDESPFAAGILLRTADNRALFLKRTKGDHAGTWALPGGKIEAEETPDQAARRETEEETGYAGADPLVQIDEGDFVTFREDVDEFEPRLNDEHSEYQWAPLDSPPAPLHPGVALTLSKIASRSAAGAALDKREYDDNGWFTVYDNPISKVGVYQYREKSVIKGGDPNKMVGVFRPPEELNNPETIKSFRLQPWTDDHPGDLLGPREQGYVPADEKGVKGVTGEQIYFKGDTLYGNIKVFSEALARKIAAGKRELSLGYHCQFIPQEGVYNGERYQYVQRNIRGNHVASVDKGRMGSDVRVLDAAECCLTFALDLKETPAMAEPRKDEAAGTVDADTEAFIRAHAADSFNSLVGELERKGYSKGYATKIAGKVAAEKGMTGHHDTAETTVPEVKDPEGKDKPNALQPNETKDAKDAKEARDRRAARDSARAARDARRAKDEMSSEEEEAEDAAECAEDAEEEKEDEKDDSKEARDRRSARDRRAGARDARKGARDRARDKAAKDAAKDSKKGMDEAEITALVQRESAAAADKAASAAAINARRDAVAANKLYQRLSPLVGAFDHDEMSHAEMAAYGLKKLGQAESKDPVTALDYYLAGRGTAVQAQRGSAQDSASTGTGSGTLDKYLAA